MVEQLKRYSASIYSILTDMAKHGLNETISWYDANSRQLADSSKAYFDLNHINSFASLLKPGAKVLDVGCGPGRDADLLTKAGLKVTGIDLSAGLISVAKDDFPNIDFIEGDMLNLPFGNYTFDGVWSNASVLHFETAEEVKKALSEMSRVLKKSGKLHLLVKAQTGEKTAVVTDSLSGNDRFFQYFTPVELKHLLTDSGFELISCKEYSEIESQPHGRPEVKLIWCLASKL